jgi:sugar phosphate isomerase/epimerase
MSNAMNSATAGSESGSASSAANRVAGDALRDASGDALRGAVNKVKPIISVFPKFLKGAGSAGEEASILASLGFTHADLLIRKGFATTASSSDESFDNAVRQYREAGLTLQSAIVDLNGPEPAMPRLLAACSRNGIGSVKIGPYKYTEGQYAADVREARTKLEGLAELAARHGVQILVQLHGGTVHSSAGLGRSLVEGLDPRHVGIYWDPGNMMHKDGHEQWALGLDILGPYLAYVGVKNVVWLRNGRKWKTEWSLLEEGIIAWPEVIRCLRRIGYTGAYSLHPFYAEDWEPASMSNIIKDLAYLQELLADHS